MRKTLASLLLCVFLLGCSGRYEYPGAKIDKFDGKIMAGENPVTFEEGQKVVLRLTLHEDGQSFGVPIQADGSFDIGWMPIGKYSAVLEYDKSTNNRRGPAQQSVRHSVPGGFEVIEEKTEYTIDLGKNFKQ